MEEKLGQYTTDIEGKLETVTNEVGGLKRSFGEMNDAVSRIKIKIEENTRKVRNKPSDDEGKYNCCWMCSN